jgi:hypothetical protein
MAMLRTVALHGFALTFAAAGAVVTTEGPPGPDVAGEHTTLSPTCVQQIRGKRRACVVSVSAAMHASNEDMSCALHHVMD